LGVELMTGAPFVSRPVTEAAPVTLRPAPSAGVQEEQTLRS
jgi:hypothetical protein